MKCTYNGRDRKKKNERKKHGPTAICCLKAPWEPTRTPVLSNKHGGVPITNQNAFRPPRFKSHGLDITKKFRRKPKEWHKAHGL